MRFWERVFGSPSAQRARPAGTSATTSTGGIYSNERTPPLLTFDELLEEARRLEKPCVFLRPVGSGPAAAVWQGTRGRSSEEFKAWLTVDGETIPGFDSVRFPFIAVFTNENDRDGKVEIVSSLPIGILLYAHQASLLPPIEAVIAFGSARLEPWLQSLNWTRDEVLRTGTLPGSPIVDEYVKHYEALHPVYSANTDVYAILGGWHWPNYDDDWKALTREKLVLMTIRDCEPWVEAWLNSTGDLHVIQRIT